MNIKGLLLFIVFFLCCNIYASYDAQETINVGIILNTSSFTTGSLEDFFISDASNKKLRLTKGTVEVLCSEEGISIKKHLLSPPVKIESSNGRIFANSKLYRGYLMIIKSENKMNIINVLPIEDYIKSVLPKEAVANWNIEALKSQAVISRTYAITNLNKHSSQGFDICSTTHCQVYDGASVEVDSCNKAVLETQCKVLSYDGKFAQTVFHANCGGHTEDPKYIWNWKDMPPYLKGVKCGYCDTAPHTKWEKTLDESFIRKQLSNNNIGKIKSIKIKGKTPTGAAKELKITHSKGEVTLNAYQFRLAVDTWYIKSHTFDFIKTDGNKFYFKGRGWGHKVGLCQWGAKGMAEKGKTYKEILAHFYPGTTIKKVVYK
ncbi:SpoIID/LytB domain-containing protein [Candidatus Endomicrobiellum trichonymphae]|uniref:SpoIID/LytB domain-containing protein n=1 Tax=Endomicrobium trichonymphae TaxID=1408204 RepID=UPI0008662C3C|nr:SpoIID/LytB domain-containing protein [Candidatus Endomicrobium trichonymphae]BAV58982.1 stage II sporulation-related protein [Candidatus Endomicrobium trichonymphae]